MSKKSHPKRPCPNCRKVFTSPYREAICGTCATEFISALRAALFLDPLPYERKSHRRSADACASNPCATNA